MKGRILQERGGSASWRKPKKAKLAILDENRENRKNQYFAYLSKQGSAAWQKIFPAPAMAGRVAENI